MEELSKRKRCDLLNSDLVIVGKFLILSSSSILLSLFSFAQVWGDLNGGVTFRNPAGAHVSAMEVFNNELYVAGTFDTAGTIAALFQARWNGITWDSVGLGFVPGSESYIDDYKTINNILYAGGNFRGLYSGQPFPNQLIPHTSNFAKWNGTIWSAVSSDDVGGSIDHVFAINSYNNELYIGGTFNQVGGVQANAIAKWDGVSWSNVGGGVTGGFQEIRCLGNYSNGLIAAGDFIQAGGVQTNFIADWNGSSWDSVGGGFDYFVTTMEIDTALNQLYVAGNFYYAGDTNTIVKGVAKWNGISWQALDTNLCGTIMTMKFYHNKLFAGGYFTYGNCWQSTPFFLACYNGINWTPVAGPNREVRSLCVFHDSLYVGGYFDTIGVSPMNHIARYYEPSTTVTNNQFIYNPFKVYPNPGKREIVVEFETDSKYQISRMSIYDIQGKLEKEFDIKEYVAIKNKIFINIESLKSGNYILEQRDPEGKKYGSQKFLVD